jgi:DNA-binding NarL/FixJ family response regulator
MIPPRALSQPCTLTFIDGNPIVIQALTAAMTSKATASTLSSAELLHKDSSANKIAPSGVLVFDKHTSFGLLRYCLQRSGTVAPTSKCLILGPTFTEAEIFTLLLEGAHGFLSYADATKHILKAATSMIEGRLWLTRSQLEGVCLHIQETRGSRRSASTHLTPRQQQILDLLKRHLSNKQIASELAISENTVKFHIGKLFSKCSTRNRHALLDLLQNRPDLK